MYLLDTDIISYAMLPKADKKLMDWLASLDEWVISATTVFQIEYGLAKAKQRKLFQESRWTEIKSETEVIPISAPIASLAATYLALSEQRGKNPGIEDMLIAATASITGRVLVTRNVKDFSQLKIGILNPI